MKSSRKQSRSVQGDRSSSRRVRELEDMLRLNAVAVKEGPAKKSWHHTDMKVIKPLTDNQGLAFTSWFDNADTHLAMLGSAGCGKSFLAIAFAMLDVLDPEQPQKKLIIVRSLAQGRSIGALPGTLAEKAAPSFRVYQTVFQQLFGKPSTMDDMVEAGLVELLDTSLLRGDTWNDSIVFVDEITSMNDHEVDTVMTRVGSNSRVIVGGDQRQSDLVISQNKADKHDYQKFIRTICNMPSFDVVSFTEDDIVRSGFVKEWIMASNRA